MAAACINVVLFGEFSLSYNGKVLAEKDYRSEKMWGVLAYLILNRKRPITQSELIQRFWDDDEGQNPLSALKTLIYRLRKLLLPLLGEELNPIISTLGSYQWNPDLLCKVDVDEFETLLHRCSSGQISVEERLDCYRKALALYRGDFLPKAINLTWHTMRSAYYHMQFSQAACEFAGLLEAQGKHEELTHVCHQTLHQGVLEEKIYVLLIRALLRQGNHSQALRQYEKATDVLYNELGIARSSAMKSLYKEIMNEGMKDEADISAILADVRDDREPGAFFCDYGLFKEVYRLEARHAARNRTSSHIALLTMVPAADKSLSKEAQSNAMKALQDTLAASLRKEDVVSQYSSTQYLILLPEADHDDTLKVCSRIEKNFKKNWYHRIVKIKTAVHAVEI